MVYRKNKQLICSLEGCDRKFYALTFCRMHYRRFRDEGTPGEIDSRHKNHGVRRVPEYEVWTRMLQRCTNVNHTHYKHYGGRGIKVCFGWYEYRNFHKDMGNKPTKGHSLDRIDVDGNYSCGHCEECLENGWETNCRWTTQNIQRWNQRPSVNSTGFTGVERVGNKYRASIMTNGVFKRLGSFNTPEEAGAAYQKAASERYLNYEN